MKRKTLFVAILFLCLTLVWLGLNIYWVVNGAVCKNELWIPAIAVLAGVGMVYNESLKKKRRHLDEVNKHKIP